MRSSTARPSTRSASGRAATRRCTTPRPRHRRVLRAALEAGIPRVVYISTVAAFGDTHGEVVDETYEHPGDGFTSYDEQTKYEAHQVARKMIDDEGLPA